MPRAAVLGSPVEHSLSPVLHSAGFTAAGLDGWDYTKHDVGEEELPAFVRSAEKRYVGFSVTMPGKFAALEMATEATDRARLIGSANTLVRTASGWRADNTDTEGILGALDHVLRAARVDSPQSAVLLGAGGTARPALWALAQRGVGQVTVVNRSDRRAEFAPLARELGIEIAWATYGDAGTELVHGSDVLMSTVPASAVNLYAEKLGHAPLVDVAYDPFPTRLAAAAAANGYPTALGHVVLAHQAYSQFEQFTGHPAPRKEMWDALVRAVETRDRPQ
ncbi:shikimate dehydrogenase [Corynebacterium massiliense]|uniref:shikimate dehydrogenase (NADP(+)) n=1 Tax=Corynebacterium massiliense DSM 45435 TaxID=1121364 RepID=A0ABY7UAV7_9CORY|nr:shikimate dehydrogenase [Corynebacterium massiliense]WCZ32597.1 Shikimate dehydrogenase [Corynebacterium massiliense DSM 45435]